MHPLIYIAKKLNLIPVPFVDTHPQLCFIRALLEANKLGVFIALDESAEGLTVDEVAQKCGISSAGAEVLLDAPRSQDYLRKRNGRFVNGPIVKRWIIGSQNIP